jgi:hypothetical protein
VPPLALVLSFELLNGRFTPEAMGSAGIQVPPTILMRWGEPFEALAADDAYRAAVGAACRSDAEADDWMWARRQFDQILAELV